VAEPRTPYFTGLPAMTTCRRYLSPTERLRLRQARIEAAERGLDKCLREVRARILRGLHVREQGGWAVVEALVADPDAVAAALEDAGFEVQAEGMLILARRPLRARKVRACKEAS
jgi:hypothetical protein